MKGVKDDELQEMSRVCVSETVSGITLRRRGAMRREGVSLHREDGLQPDFAQSESS